ncbi:4881_t:CDS:2, partial [Dentiscutata heterogama]
FWEAGERAFQAERHIMLQSGKINFEKLANIKVTKVNNTKFNRKERSQKILCKMINLKETASNVENQDILPEIATQILKRTPLTTEEEYYSESEEETEEESDNEEVITANNLHKTIQKK